MRALFFIVAIAACNVPDRHYIKGDANGSGSGDAGIDTPTTSNDSPTDAPPSLAMGKGYLLDFTAGIYRVSKDKTTGALSLVTTTPIAAGAPQAAAINKAGTHLYTTDTNSTNPAIRDWTINPDGSLTAGATTSLIMGTAQCTPWFVTTHPSGNWLAVGCQTPYVATIPIQANGTLGAVLLTSAGNNPLNPVFSTDGKCLFLADLNGSASGGTLKYFAFNAATGALTNGAAVSGPGVPRGIATHPNGYVYLAGGTVQMYTFSSSCVPTASGAAVTVGGNTNFVTIDSTGTHLYVTGTEVYGFTIGSGGVLTGFPNNPYISTGTTMDGAIMDPAVPDILYITGRGYMGTILADINTAQQTIVQGNPLTVTTGGTMWLQLAP